ncbi:MAG: BLUF domain-containing protein [Oceanicaulis sp.]
MLLVRALYYSQAASRDREAVRSILGAAQRNNPALNLTGVLIHDRGRYLQVLEGARPVVSAMIARIGDDPRHTGMALADFAEVDRRRFAGFSMAFTDADADFHSTRLTDFDAAPADAIYRQIESYVKKDARRAA